MAIDYTHVDSGRQWVPLLASAARTATPNQQQIELVGDVDALVIVVTATAVAAAGSVTPKIEGVDPVTQATYPILTAGTTAVVNTTNTATTYTYKVGQGLPASTTAQAQSANDVVPPVVRVTLTHADATNSFTYSVTALTPN